jgi:ATP-dependent 26S proteasome regulatory subunit
MNYIIFSFSSYLPREVDPLVYNMSHEDPGDVTFSEVGGLSEQIRELREVNIPLNDIRNLIYRERTIRIRFD